MAIDWGSLLQMKKDGTPRASLTNAVLVLQNDPFLGPDYLWYDATLDRVMLACPPEPPHEWDKTDDVKIAVYMQRDPIRAYYMQPATVWRAAKAVARDRVKRTKV